MEEFKNLKRVALNEARKLDAAYANKDEFTEGDMKKYDCIMHGLKSQLTAEAMLGSEEYSEEGVSGMRGRSPMTGRYVSREQESRSYNDGYEHGYSQAMREMNQNGGNSGHMPMNPYYPEQRRW